MMATLAVHRLFCEEELYVWFFLTGEWRLFGGRKAVKMISFFKMGVYHFCFCET